MNSASRDAIIRLTSSTDWHLFLQWVLDEQAKVSNALTTVNPDDIINISRIQGRVAAYNTVLNIQKLAEDELNNQRTNNNE